MRKLLTLLLLLGAALLRAEIPVTEFDFTGAGSSDTGSNWAGQAGWTNAFTKKCKARLNGIGLAPPASSNGQSGMKYTWETGDSETIAQITVTCMASGTTAAGAKKIHTLGVRVNDTLMTESFSFDGAVDSPLTFTFRLESPVEVTSVVITNETDQSGNTSLFEVSTVSWQAAFPGIEATFIAPTKATALSTLSISLETLNGGSGEYVELYFTFNGEIVWIEGREVVTFQAPAIDGVYPLTLTVVDSSGEVATFVQDIQITPTNSPVNLQVSEITREGFSLSWELPGVASVVSYKVDLKPMPASRTTEELRPAWVETAEGWELGSPIDLTQYSNGLPISTALLILTEAWEGTLTHCFSTDADQITSVPFSTRRILGGVPKDASLLYLQTDAETPPAAFTLMLNFAVVAEQTLTASGVAHTVTFTDLPAGNTFAVTVRANHLKDDGTTLSAGSDPLRVELLPIPPFKSVTANTRYKSLTFTWPEGDEALPGTCVIQGERRTSSALSGDLYLSRVVFTKKTSDCDQLASGKAIALSNTGSRAIALDGRYACTITRPRTNAEIAAGKTEPLVYTWDFSVKDEDGTLTYPYTVPAGGDIIFHASAYPPLDLREVSIASTVPVLRNLTADYTLSLSKNGVLCNELKPQENAVVRLAEGSLTETELTAVTNETQTLNPFYTSWGVKTETVTFASIPLQSMSGSAQIFYSPYLTNLEDVLSVRARCYLRDGYTRSAETAVELYAAPAEPTAPGFMLRLR